VRVSAPISGYVFRLVSRSPRLGEAVAAFGFPLGLPLTVTRGSVSGLDRSIPIEGFVRRRLVQTDAAVNPGNSGGPLISTKTGDVLGLVDLGTSEANGLAFAVSALVAQPLLQAWRAAPQTIAAASCGSTSPPVAAPGPSQGGSQDKSADRQAVADTIYGYWNAIQQGDYATAFRYLSPAERQAVGGEQTFVSQHEADPLSSVDVEVAVTLVGSSTASADVVRLRTIAPSTGCRDWSGSYDLVRQSGSWFITSAKLNFTAC
jgi:serine protease Do